MVKKISIKNKIYLVLSPRQSRPLGGPRRGIRRGTGKTLLVRSVPPDAQTGAIHPRCTCRPAGRKHRGVLASSNKGFTLIEMMVAVTIFSIVTLIVSGAFIVLADIYRQVQSNRAVIDNLNLAMDTMTLQIREGKEYEIINDNQISFREYIIDENNQYIRARYLTYKLKDDNSGILEQCVNESKNDCNDLTSSEIKIEKLLFERQRQEPALILVVMEGVASNKENIQSRFLLQSTLSQRNP